MAYQMNDEDIGFHTTRDIKSQFLLMQSEGMLVLSRNENGLKSIFIKQRLVRPFITQERLRILTKDM